MVNTGGEREEHRAWTHDKQLVFIFVFINNVCCHICFLYLVFYILYKWVGLEGWVTCSNV